MCYIKKKNKLTERAGDMLITGILAWSNSMYGRWNLAAEAYALLLSHIHDDPKYSRRALPIMVLSDPRTPLPTAPRAQHTYSTSFLFTVKINGKYSVT